MSETQAEGRNWSNVDLLHKAAASVIAGTHKNSAVAAKAYGVSGRTVRARVVGTHTQASKAHEKQQALPPVLEETLIEYLGTDADKACGLDKDELRIEASRLAGRTVGVNWVDRFRKRHSDKIDFSRPHLLDIKRGKALNPAAVKKHFDLLEQLMSEHDFPPENIYNMDEKGIQLGGGRGKRPRKVIKFVRTKSVRRISTAENMELVTVVECIAADGGALRPTMILKGRRRQASWFAWNPDNIE